MLDARAEGWTQGEGRARGGARGSDESRRRQSERWMPSRQSITLCCIFSLPLPSVAIRCHPLPSIAFRWHPLPSVAFRYLCSSLSPSATIRHAQVEVFEAEMQEDNEEIAETGQPAAEDSGGGGIGFGRRRTVSRDGRSRVRSTSLAAAPNSMLNGSVGSPLQLLQVTAAALWPTVLCCGLLCCFLLHAPYLSAERTPSTPATFTHHLPPATFRHPPPSAAGQDRARLPGGAASYARAAAHDATHAR